MSITRICSVKLSDQLVLANVLFVPYFCFNVLSISSLTKSHNCSVNFLANSFLIQDHTQDKMIGKGRRQGNLYVLDIDYFCHSFSKISASCNNLTLSPVELWHYRLRHPSHVKIQNLRNELSFSSNSTFPSHCDVWGPFHTYSTEGFCYFLTIIDDNTQFTWVYFLKSKFDVNTIMP